MKIKYIVIISLGILATYLFTVLFAYIDFKYLGTSDLIRRCFAPEARCSDEEFYSGIKQGIVRSDFIYNPVIMILIAFFIGMAERGRIQIALVLSAVLPFVMFQLFTKSFSLYAFFLSVFYLVLVVATSYFIRTRLQKFSTVNPHIKL